MDIDYLKSHFQKMDTKELVRIIYFNKDSYADKTIKEAISELKRRGDYKDDILVPLSNQIKDEIKDITAKIDKNLNTSPSPVIISILIAFSITTGILNYFSSPYLFGINFLIIPILMRIPGKQWWRYLGIGLVISALTFWTIYLLKVPHTRVK